MKWRYFFVFIASSALGFYLLTLGLFSGDKTFWFIFLFAFPIIITFSFYLLFKDSWRIFVSKFKENSAPIILRVSGAIILVLSIMWFGLRGAVHTSCLAVSIGPARPYQHILTKEIKHYRGGHCSAAIPWYYEKLDCELPEHADVCEEVNNWVPVRF